MNISWPRGHKFAFTIFDDTDWATVDNVKPVYDVLTNLGMRTTKAVWMFRGERTPVNEGSTCENKEYLEWIFSLQELGFEIGLHNVAPCTSPREWTRIGLDIFRELFGNQKIVHCNHTGCLEGIYWGDARLSGWRRTLYNILTRGKNYNVFRGHIEGDPLFWGDLCRERVRYVRNFVFDDLNTLAACPEMPYHDRSKPFVDFWFTSAEGANRRTFLNNFTFANFDRLEEEGGLCIAYVHFAADFVHDGKVHAEVLKRMEYIASKDGWFAPVSQVLDYLRNNGGRTERTISPARLRQLETRWLFGKVFKGTT